MKTKSIKDAINSMYSTSESINRRDRMINRLNQSIKESIINFQSIKKLMSYPFHSFTASNEAHALTFEEASPAITVGQYSPAITVERYSPAITAGNEAHVATFGEFSPAIAAGFYKSNAVTCNANSIAASFSIQGAACGVLGSWLVLAEYSFNAAGAITAISSVKAAQVDGVNILPNVCYKLVNQQFVPIK